MGVDSSHRSSFSGVSSSRPSDEKRHFLAAGGERRLPADLLVLLSAHAEMSPETDRQEGGGGEEAGGETEEEGQEEEEECTLY